MRLWGRGEEGEGFTLEGRRVREMGGSEEQGERVRGNKGVEEGRER